MKLCEVCLKYYQKLRHSFKKFVYSCIDGGAVASWLVRWSPDRVFFFCDFKVGFRQAWSNRNYNDVF